MGRVMLALDAARRRKDVYYQLNSLQRLPVKRWRSIRLEIFREQIAVI